MKRLAAVLLALVFVWGFVHFYFAEDHCPIHCPTKGGHFGHVHQHHSTATCLCFWAAFFAPDSPEIRSFLDGAMFADSRPEGGPLRPFSADISHPPKSRLL